MDICKGHGGLPRTDDEYGAGEGGAARGGVGWLLVKFQARDHTLGFREWGQLHARTLREFVLEFESDELRNSAHPGVTDLRQAQGAKLHVQTEQSERMANAPSGVDICVAHFRSIVDTELPPA
jgi:hypothetical protein